MLAFLKHRRQIHYRLPDQFRILGIISINTDHHGFVLWYPPTLLGPGGILVAGIRLTRYDVFCIFRDFEAYFGVECWMLSAPEQIKGQPKPVEPFR